MNSVVTESTTRLARPSRGVLTVCVSLALLALLAGCGGGDEGGTGTLGPTVPVSGTLTYPSYTQGNYYMGVVDAAGQVLLLQQVPGGNPVDYTLEVPTRTEPLSLVAMLDHDSDGEFTHFVDPCHLRTVNLTNLGAGGVDLTLQDGGCLEDATGASPFSRFAQDKPWPAHFAHQVVPGVSYTVSTANAEQAVDLAVYDDVNGNNRYDVGTDTELCTSALPLFGTESCVATPTSHRLIPVVTVESGSPQRDVYFDLSVTPTPASVTISGTINFPAFVSGGQFQVLAVDVDDNVVGTPVTVAPGISVPYSLDLPGGLGLRRIAAMYDDDLDNEATGWVEPSDVQTILAGSQNLTVDFNLADGSNVYDFTGRSPFRTFTQEKSWTGHFSHLSSTGTNYRVSVTNASAPVNLAVYADMNDNGRYDLSDSSLCSSTIPDSGAESCLALAAAGRLIIAVSAENDVSKAQVFFDVTVEPVDPVMLSGTVHDPDFDATGGELTVLVLNGSGIVNATVVPGSINAPYTVPVPASVGAVTVVGIRDHDRDGEYNHFVEPCHWLDGVTVGTEDVPDVDLSVQAGGCSEDVTGPLPTSSSQFTQNKPWPATFARSVSGGANYTVSTSAADSPVDLAVYNDMNGNGRYDASTDTLFCASAAAANGNESCSGTTDAAATRLLIRVSVEPGSAVRDVGFTLGVTSP